MKSATQVHSKTTSSHNRYDISTVTVVTVRSSGLLCCGSDGLEHTARQHQRYGSVNLLFQTLSEDSSFLLLLAYQRIRGFAFMRYINLRLTLTLTLSVRKSTCLSMLRCGTTQINDDVVDCTLSMLTRFGSVR